MIESTNLLRASRYAGLIPHSQLSIVRGSNTRLNTRRDIASSVAHTIFRPGRLTDEPGSGKIRTRFSGGDGFDISRQNVARCIAAALESPAARNQVVDLLDGDQLISTLFSAA